MGRRPKTYASEEPKVRRSVTIDADLDAWVQQQVGTGKPFSSYSHAVQSAVAQLRQRAR